MKIDNISIYNTYPAIIAIRNSTQTREKGDTKNVATKSFGKIISYNHAVLGEGDKDLIIRLLKLSRDTGKTNHRKFLRQMFVTFDVLAPKSFWSVLDSYKIGVSTSSSNTMTLLTKVVEGKQKLGLEHFEYTDSKEESALSEIFKKLNLTNDINLITTLLPQSFLLLKSWSGSYENLLNIYLDQYQNEFYQWQLIIKMIKSLPLMDDLIIPSSI